jgi:bifunctional NMN adenylyltransferase/nudix hydrolase
MLRFLRTKLKNSRLHKWLLATLGAEVIYDTSFQAVDVFVVNRRANKILLGRKKNSTKWRLIGGFVDPADSSLEYAAVREKNEEAHINLECSPPKYLFSARVDDPRYRDSRHKVMTAVFRLDYIFGSPLAQDDIEEVKWFTKTLVREEFREIVAAEHIDLFKRLKDMGELDSLELEAIEDEEEDW